METYKNIQISCFALWLARKKNVSKKSTFYNTIPILNSVFLLIIVVDQTKWPNQILKSKSNINLLCLKINEKLLCLWFKWVYWVLYTLLTNIWIVFNKKFQRNASKVWKIKDPLGVSFSKNMTNFEMFCRSFHQT